MGYLMMRNCHVAKIDGRRSRTPTDEEDEENQEGDTAQHSCESKVTRSVIASTAKQSHLSEIATVALLPRDDIFNVKSQVED